MAPLGYLGSRVAAGARKCTERRFKNGSAEIEGELRTCQKAMGPFLKIAAKIEAAGVKDRAAIEWENCGHRSVFEGNILHPLANQKVHNTIPI